MPTKKLSAATKLPGAVQLIERRIYLVRGQKVMLDFDLADLYEVSTKALNQAVKHNRNRFPADFMFRLTLAESQVFTIRSQIVTGSKRNVRFQPYAFTEHGIAMLSSVLRSERAVEVNIAIMRTFIKMQFASHFTLLPPVKSHMRERSLDNWNTQGAGPKVCATIYSSE